MAKSGDRLGECRFCMTEISRRARVCPQCQRELSFTAGIWGFFRSAAWVIATVVSLGFAILERVERLGLADELEQLGIALTVKEVEAEVLRDVVVEQAQSPAGLAESLAPPPLELENSPVELAQPQPTRRIEEVDEQIDQLTRKPTIDRQRLKMLEKERLRLELSRRR